MTGQDNVRHEHYDMLSSDTTMILEFNNQAKIEYISESCKNILGYSQDEMLNTIGYNYMFEPDIEYIKELQQNYNFNPKDVRQCTRYRKYHKNGSLVWLEATSPQRINESLSVCFEKLITEQKLLEDNSLKGQCADHIFDYLFECTANGLIRYINPALKQLSLYTYEEMIMKINVNTLLKSNFELKKGTYECYFYPKDTQRIAVECNIVYNAKSQMFAGIFKKFEMNQNELFRNFVHELRNPVNSLMQGNDYLNIKVKEFEETIYNEMPKSIQVLYYTEFKQIKDSQNTSISLLKELLNDFLDFQKIKSNVFEINTNQEFNLRNFIQNVKNIINPFLHFEDKIINYKYCDNCNCSIKTDQIRLKQVIINLVHNAIKYSDSKGICVYFENNTSNLNITITHTVLSQNSIELKKMFKPFFRMDKLSNNGTGLGLYICKQILEKMNGTIDVTINNNNFNMAISCPIQSISKKITILIVDDFPGIKTTRMLLQLKGFEVDVVNSGECAVENYIPFKYDIILMDKNMNGISGLHATKTIKEINEKQIIYGFTGDTISNASSDFLMDSKDGVNNILYKPLDVDLLMK